MGNYRDDGARDSIRSSFSVMSTTKTRMVGPDVGVSQGSVM